MQVTISKFTVNGITRYLVRGLSDAFYVTHVEALEKAAEVAHMMALSLLRPVGINDRSAK